MRRPAASRLIAPLLAATVLFGSAAPAAGAAAAGPAGAAAAGPATGAAAGRDAGTLRIGSKRFTEGYLLAELVAQTAQPHVAVDLRAGLGNTAIVFEALRSGSIDVYPDYTGTIAREILHQQASDPDALRAALAPQGLTIDVPLGFGNGYGLAMRASRADALGIGRISDLARHPELRVVVSNEFLGRADGWAGVAAAYGLPQRATPMDHGLIYGAIGAGGIDVIDVYTTDAMIEQQGLRVLDDDRAFFPRYDAVLLLRADVPQRFPNAWAAVRALSGRIGEPAMRHLNATAEIGRQPFAQAVQAWRAQQAAAPAADDGRAPVSGAPQSGAAAPADGRTPVAPVPPARPGASFVDRLFGPDSGRLLLQHVGLVAASLAASTVIGIPLGVLGARRPRVRQPVLSLVGLLQTIPSLALLALLIGLTGTIGAWPTLIALTLYGLLPIVRNTVTGLLGVPPGLPAAGRALGLRPMQVLRLVELPLALPSILAGVRTACVTAVGTATIAAFVGAGGFGDRIVTGLALNDRTLLLAGAVPAALLALLAEAGLERLERRLLRRQAA